jgi:hypothetical protein
MKRRQSKTAGDSDWPCNGSRRMPPTNAQRKSEVRATLGLCQGCGKEPTGCSCRNRQK